MRRLLATAAVGSALTLSACGGADGDEGTATTPAVTAPTAGVTDLARAARDAGCTVRTHADEGKEHTAADVRYRTNPPTSGDHDPQWADDGRFPRGAAPDTEQSVHALEHGRINVQYRPGLDEDVVDRLEAVAGEPVKGSAGYHTLFFQNQTGMTAQIAATAWRHSLTCPRANDRVYDAIRAFRTERIDKGPEFVP
jgi:hypothetical protein